MLLFYVLLNICSIIHSLPTTNWLWGKVAQSSSEVYFRKALQMQDVEHAEWSTLQNNLMKELLGRPKRRLDTKLVKCIKRHAGTVRELENLI